MRTALIAPNPSTPTEWVRIDQPYSYTLLRVKQQLVALETMLRFYKPVVTLAAYALPLITLLMNIAVIRPPSGWFTPMFFPFLAMLLIVYERGEPQRRWGLFKAIGEGLLSILISAKTAICFIKAANADKQLFIRRSFFEHSTQAFRWSSLLAYSLVGLTITAIFWGSIVAIEHYAAGRYNHFQIDLCLLTLAALNIINLLGRQAILHETEHILAFTDSKKIIPTTLVLTSGQTLVCSTTNYPDPLLGVRLPPNSVDLIRDDTMLLQFSHDGAPFNLTVHKASLEGDTLFVKTTSGSISQANALKSLLMTRSTDWPQWLPGKHADVVLPAWLHQRIENIPAVAAELGTKLMMLIKFENLIGLLKK